jgi:cupin fold WbuC family metalloprotein
MIQPFHRSEQDTLHRMFNAVQPDSYVRPHRHLDPPKAEAWIVLRGAVVFFTFEEDGAIRDCIELRASGPAFGVDLVPGVFHTFSRSRPARGGSAGAELLISQWKFGPGRSTT